MGDEKRKCVICGAPAFSGKVGTDGAVLWLCTAHVEGEALKTYEYLEQKRRSEPADKSADDAKR